MAVVTFEVQCRIIHPDTKQPLIAYDAEYEPYNVIIEKSNSQNKPDDLVGTVTWPLSNKNGIEQNILVEVLKTGIGSGLRGYEQNSKHLDALMNNQAVISQIQQLLLYQTEINDLAVRIEEDIKLRDNVARLIKRDHNGAILDYTAGTVSGDYYTHNSVQGYITYSGCKSTTKETTPTFGDSYRFAHSEQCDENVRLFAQYCSKIAASTALKTNKQNSMISMHNLLVRSVQNYIHQAELNFAAERNSVDNPLYNSLFIFKGTRQAYTREYVIQPYKTVPIGNSTAIYPDLRIQNTVLMDCFTAIRGNIWNTTSTHGSEPAAQKAAAYLGKSVGMENVRIVKLVPLDTKVIIEGQN